MKTNKISFGLGVVVSGQKSNVVNAKPELYALSTKGGFTVTAPVSKRLGIAPGENIMFINNLTALENAIATKADALVEYCTENNIDIDSYEGQQTLIKTFGQWYIAKGYAKKDKTGNALKSTIRVTLKDKADYLAENMDKFVADNREALIAKHNLDNSATDDDIKAVVVPEDVASPVVDAYEGCKTATTSSTTGVGCKLNFTDSSTWEQLKGDLSDEVKEKTKRVFSVDVNDVDTIQVNNGYETVDVTVYPITFVSDEEVVDRKKK